MTASGWSRAWRLTAVALAAAALAVGGGVSQAAAGTASSTVCRFNDARLDEISGMAWSLRHPGILWIHNDSGGGPYIYAIDAMTCRTVARVRLTGAPDRDYEAIATGKDDAGRDMIWLADIGDNRDSWPSVRIVAIPEPSTLTDGMSVASTTYPFTYPTGPRNAEALLADPARERLWVATKVLGSGAAVWALPRLRADQVVTATRVADAGVLITDGAVSADGSRTVLRDYIWAYVFAGLPSPESLARAPVVVTLPTQPQGEAVVWARDGRALLVASERDDRLLRMELPRTAWTATALATDPLPSTAPPSASASTSGSAAGGEAESGGSVGLVLLGIGVLAVGAGGWWAIRRGRASAPADPDQLAKTRRTEGPKPQS